MIRFVSLVAVLLVLPLERATAQDVVIGSKKFTENIILGEIAAHLATDSKMQVEHRAELGGTQVLWGALKSGNIDIYPEYSGTIYEEIFAGAQVDAANLAEKLSEYGVSVSPSLGFDNTYVLGISRETASRTGITSISDLRNFPDLRFGFSNEFLARGDGWPALRGAYNLAPKFVRGMDHDIAYRGLAEGNVDVIDLYSTDAEIEYYDIVTLDDDRSFFPAYNAVYLYRSELAETAPEFVRAIRALEGKIPAELMIRLNAGAKLDGRNPSELASEFLKGLEIFVAPVDIESRTHRIVRNSRDHMVLVLISLTIAILVSLPLGIAASMNDIAGRIILAIVGGLYTVPSLALLVFMIPLLGIGAVPAIVALFLYSLLPIVRNTYTGLVSIAPDLDESAIAMGLDRWTRLIKIQLPLASRSILAGIKTAAVINIGTATLGALIGAGGLGQPILTGIRLNDTALILEGAIPAALLAFIAQWLFDFSERFFVPAGLRLSTEA